MQEQTGFKPIYCDMCGDYIEWDMSQDRSTIIVQVCPSCKENTPPPHKRRKYISISKYTKPTRKDVRNSLGTLLAAIALFGLFNLACLTNSELLFPWLSSIPFITAILVELSNFTKNKMAYASQQHNGSAKIKWFKRIKWSNIVACLIFITFAFAIPVMAAIFAFGIYVFGGLWLILYSISILLKPYLANEDNSGGNQTGC